MGDAGKPYDPANNAQNKSSLLGKVLRIDVDNPEDGKPYSIPLDNPFVNDPSFRPEIYAYGLRNPWRCGKDLGDYVTGKGKGRMACGDVGEHTKEEVDLIKKGANYGWNIMEGDFCVPKKKCSKAAVTENFEEPIWNYGHDLGFSVIGGAFYRGCSIQHLYGAVIVGEWGSGLVDIEIIMQ
ncbi:hypothetical protein FSP39_017602 [Pinctada imbricata]|uniref:Glucose/Sorbosone dehydrogenase domain-containing protein n=1 Tax=Pinctada imbricata TaxID=66713 RepID=A0AA88XJH8_PINIB|nr:hypothetical protein FSP39_017602 [Pinctada imbricata]